MQQATNYIKTLDENNKRLITLASAMLVTFTVLAIFPLNVLVIYLAARSYSNNRLDLYQGIKSEFVDLVSTIKQLNKDSSKEVQPKNSESLPETKSSGNISELSEGSDEDTKKIK